MRKNTSTLIWASVLVICLTGAAHADVRIKMSQRKFMPGMPGPINTPAGVKDPSQMPDTTVYIKGGRLRREVRTEKYTMTGPKKVVFTSLQQCDLGRQVNFTSDKKKYQVTYMNNAGGAPDARRERGGAVELSVTYTDTGERQTMFGLTARRVKSLTTLTPGPSACQKTSMKIESDAWYVDLQGQTCPGLAAEQTFTGENGGCSDRIHFRVEGRPEYGFAVKETRVISAVGQPPITLKSEAVEFSQTELDPVLFDVPEGYEEDKNSAAARTAENRDGDSRGLGLPAPGDLTGAAQSSSPTPEAAPSTTATAQTPSPSQLSPKRPGVIRIGVAKPKVQTPDSDEDASAPLDVGIATRDSFVAAFKGEAVEAVALTSPQPEQEAKQKECDYTLYSNVVQKRGGGGGLFGKMAAMSALSMAGAMVPGVGGIVSSVATSVLMGQTMGKTARPKDEFSLEFYAIAADDHSLLYKSQSKQKVSKQGEDVLTPQIQKAAAAVLAEVRKKHSTSGQDWRD